MKFNRWTLGLAAVAAVALTLGTGCSTTAPQSVNLGVTTATVATNGILYLGGAAIQPAAAGVVIKMAAQAGAQALLKQDPTSREYLAIAAGVIDTAIINTNYNPGALEAAVTAALPVNDSTAAIVTGISDGLNLYELFYAQVVTSKIGDASPYLLPCLQGLADGITQALALTPATTTVATPAAAVTVPATATAVTNSSQ